MTYLPGYEVPGKHYDITYLCLGAGVQSTALLLMSNLGLYGTPKADYAIFADTGAEPESVYLTLEGLEKVSKIPIVRVKDGDLEKEFIEASASPNKRCPAIPAFTRDPISDHKGILIRQCTADKKIKPIELYLKREILGLKHGQRVKSMVRAMMGISWDETQRMKPSRNKWCDMSYP